MFFIIYFFCCGRVCDLIIFSHFSFFYKLMTEQQAIFKKRKKKRFLNLKKIFLLGKEHDASKYGPTDPHFMYFLDEAQLKWKGKIIPNTKAMAVITFCDPAGIYFFRFNIPDIGNIVLFHTHLPSGNMKLRVRFHWYADRNMTRILVWYVVGLWISQGPMILIFGKIKVIKYFFTFITIFLK
ncbi:Rieske non-heme iron oxygenase family protein [Reticulomyxa filosa]|uniref:Rieske non-heme iron oxygenase family protein n=1 Tax=Reticulomyxa filosa TaxID=46433 RepID=X6MLJ7_RETFI|nr:Rieske non-heme iron oxygenase family protein [Reticulomyxa filosa]|eukprot:ETO14521.1 Rieske non-heme iron oxygenase family protein [Reticulomyxa filosa]